jgi:hypothetical protein
MLHELQGIQAVDGELVVVGVENTSEGRRRVHVPIDVAFGIGCVLIELWQLAKEREDQLRSSGELLDLQAMRQDFATRLRRRMLNGSEDNAGTGTVLPDGSPAHV